MLIEENNKKNNRENFYTRKTKKNSLKEATGPWSVLSWNDYFYFVSFSFSICLLIRFYFFAFLFIYISLIARVRDIGFN